MKKSIDEIKKAAKSFPNHEIVVTGCASQIEKKKFSSLKNVSQLVENKNKTHAESYTGKLLTKKKTLIFRFLIILPPVDLELCFRFSKVVITDVPFVSFPR